MSLTLFKRFLLLLTFTGLILPASAQDTDLEVYELFDVTLEELLNVGIVSASKKKQSVLDAPATAYVVTEEQISTRGYTNLSELLEDIPEIEIQRNSSNYVRNHFSIRGVAGNEKFLILLNGIRITPSTGDSYTLSHQYSLANAKRVEVIIGPASALYGVDAFSGIINIITRNQEGTAVKGAELQTSYGSFNTTDNFLIAGTKFDKLKVSVTGNYYYSSEPDYSKYYKDEYQWYNNRFKTNGSVIESPFFQKIRDYRTFQKWAGDSFYGDTLSRDFSIPTYAYYFNAEAVYEDFTVGLVRHDERHSSAYSIDPRYTAFEKDAFIKMTQQVLYGRHLFTSFNKKWRLQSNFTQSFFEVDPDSYIAGSVTRWQRGYFYSYNQSSRLEEQFQYDFSRKTTLTAGISYEYQTALPRTGLSPKPINDKEPIDIQNIYLIGASGYASNVPDGQPIQFDENLTLEQKVYYLQYQNFGSYAQLQFHPFKWLETTIGSRYDYNTRYGGSINPRMGLVAKPGKKIHLKLLYGEAFLAPSPEKAYQQSGSFYEIKADSFRADYFKLPNPDLKPEKLRSLEGGFNYFITSNFNLAANGFYTNISNLINLFGQSDQSAPNQVTALRLEKSVNEGTSEIYGGTLRLNLLNRIGAATVNTYAAYTLINGHINRDQLLYTAENTIKGGIDVGHKRFSLSPRVTWRSSSYSVVTDGPDGDNFKNKPFYLINLNARYKLINKTKLKLTVFADVTNLLDNRYYHVLYGSEEGLPLTPQDPFRIMGGINIKGF
jgi:iron complex outermembrane receptor protein